MLEKIGKFKLLVVGALVSFLFIAITIGQLQKRQETRSRASGEAVSVILNPQTKNVAVGQPLDINVTVNGGQNNVSAVDITFSYDVNLLGNPDFQPATTFTTIVNDTATPGTIHFVGVNPTSNAITGSSISLGSLSFAAKTQGTATVGFSNIHINASGVAGALPVDTENTKEGTYSISDSAQATSAPSPTSTGTTCSTCLAQGKSFICYSVLATKQGPFCSATNIGDQVGSPTAGCEPCLSPTPTLPPVPPESKLLIDLNDDGKIDEIDLNILYSGFAKRKGD